MDGLTGPEQERLTRLQHFQDDMMGYVHIQATRPQTLAHGLTDSPAGQLAWMVEKFKEWSDPTAELPTDAVGRDRLLTDVSVYWFTATAGSSALYYESRHDPAAWAPRPRGTVPTGVAVSRSQDVAIRRLAERDHNIVRWTEFERGGHFAALEHRSSWSATCGRSSAGSRQHERRSRRRAGRPAWLSAVESTAPTSQLASRRPEAFNKSETTP